MMCDPEFIKKRLFIKQFIRLYESFPSLWNLKSYQYHDRDLRAKAYKVLVKKFQEIQPGADRMAVVKKINCLRSNLRKEKRKILEGAKAGRVIKPSLWYYHHFNFLNGVGRKAEKEETDLEAAETINIQNITSGTQIKIEGRANDPLESVENCTDESNEDRTFPQFVETDEPSPSTYEVEPVQMSHPANSVTGSNYKSVTESHRRQEQDRHDAFGKNVAMKLRYISSKNETQRIMAEKIMNEALSLAEMGLLTMEHCKVLK